MIEIRISGGENANDSTFYKVHPKIKEYKYGVAQPGKCGEGGWLMSM